MELNGGSLSDIRFREYDGDFCSSIGHFAREMRLRSINDIGRINPNRPPNELNSPLFLPCSRPKQGWGFSDRMRIPK
jgi:hypothetical protein